MKLKGMRLFWHPLILRLVLFRATLLQTRNHTDIPMGGNVSNRILMKASF